MIQVPNLRLYSVLLERASERGTIHRANPDLGQIEAFAPTEAIESIAKELSAYARIKAPDLLALLPTAPAPIPLEILAQWLDYLPINELNWLLRRLLDAGKIHPENEEFSGEVYQLFKSSGTTEQVEVAIRRSHDPRVAAIVECFVEGKIDLCLGMRKDQQPDLLWRASPSIVFGDSRH
jgi:hypothetical protein